MENTKSHLEIESLFFHWKKNGKLILKTKNRREIFEKELKKEKNQRKQKKQGLKISTKVKFWFFKNIQYDEVCIEEKIGALNPLLTAYALPFVATITTFPLHFLNVNFRNFQYNILPDYNQLIFVLHLKAKASFRIIDLIMSIFQEFLHKLCTRS